MYIYLVSQSIMEWKEYLCKVRVFKPGFSKKDRIALQMIEEAEVRIIEKRTDVVELTSGNTGTGLALDVLLRISFCGLYV